MTKVPVTVEIEFETASEAAARTALIRLPGEIAHSIQHGAARRRGSYRAQFESAWARYALRGVTPSQPSNSHTSATVEPSQFSPAVTL